MDAMKAIELAAKKAGKPVEEIRKEIEFVIEAVINKEDKMVRAYMEACVKDKNKTGIGKIN